MTAGQKKCAQAPPARRQAVKAKSGKVSVSSKAKPAVAKAKPVAKTAKSVAAKKAAAKPLAKKAPVKPVAKKAVATPAARKAAKPVAKAKPGGKGKPAAKPVAKAASPVVKAVPKAPIKAAMAAVPRPARAAAPEAPARTAKASARLAQLTVPSMAQATASNAAKASYTSTMSQPLIAPPLPSSIKKDPKLANNWKTKPGDQLSDEELMAMPDAEYMNDKQLAAFRVRLQRLRQDILTNAGETTEHLREETVIVPDPADRATIEEEHALELRTRDRERKLLKKIEQSIVRIDSGDYGYCDETGEPIGVGRLLARPTATLSLEAQQRRELKQKMFGD
ncbi:MAG: RNA polymerase-binding protein DksA [Curvibacter sp.]|nr:RNA polymerase-binding protein DksA [Curvibacter sp.]